MFTEQYKEYKEIWKAQHSGKTFKQNDLNEEEQEILNNYPTLH
jgi:hypothetical protein